MLGKDTFETEMIGYQDRIVFFSFLWVKQCHKPPMTGNGKFIPPIYLWLWLGDVYDDIVFPTLAGLLGQLHIKTKKNPQVTWLKSTRLGVHTAAR